MNYFRLEDGKVWHSDQLVRTRHQQTGLPGEEEEPMDVTEDQGMEERMEIGAIGGKLNVMMGGECSILVSI